MTRKDLLAKFDSGTPADVARIADVEFIGWMCQWGPNGGPNGLYHHGHWLRDRVTRRGVSNDGKYPCPDCRPVFVGTFQ